MPFSAPRASAWAARIVLAAASTAVANPKLRSHPVQVVVDRLGDADHSQRSVSAHGFGRDRTRPAQRAVATDAKEDRHVVPNESVDHSGGILSARDEARMLPPWT